MNGNVLLGHFFFFKQKTAYEMRISDWSSDVCSSDLPFWRAIGWDISDGAGHELICAHCFDRQIIAATGDLVEGACVNLDARGALTRAPVDEGALEDSLKREADAFIAKHRRQIGRAACRERGVQDV